MNRALPAALLLAVAALAALAAPASADVIYKTFPMDYVRMCAAWHCEGCSPDAATPGPCQSAHECKAIVCNPAQAGNCVSDPSLSWCDDISCNLAPHLLRQHADTLGRLSH